MSRTHKHSAARRFHKALRAATFGHRWNGGTGPQDSSAREKVWREATPAQIGTTRYGVNRTYYADYKIKMRRVARCQGKQGFRRSLHPDQFEL